MSLERGQIHIHANPTNHNRISVKYVFLAFSALRPAIRCNLQLCVVHFGVMVVLSCWERAIASLVVVVFDKRVCNRLDLGRADERDGRVPAHHKTERARLRGQLVRVLGVCCVREQLRLR